MEAQPAAAATAPESAREPPPATAPTAATAGAVLSKYADHDDSTRAAWISGDLAEETRLPRELVLRLYEMWFARDRPFFDKVSEDGVLAPKDLVEVVRTLKIDDVLLCNSVAGVISEGRPVTFDVFIRGYAALNSRTLREALPFAFKVFDIDGDGRLGPTEFKLILEANLKHQGLDAAAANRVLAAGGGPDTGMDRDQFRYFASQSAETVLAACGFLLKVRDFYVPLIPFGTEEEERQEEEERRRKREEAAAGGAAADADAGPEADVFDEDFMAALESLKTTPEERALRLKDKGNDALKQGRPAQHAQTRRPGSGRACHLRLEARSRSRSRMAAPLRCRTEPRPLGRCSAALEPLRGAGKGR